jgi:CTP:molybdopterin cytidylyltransferase MocA
MITDPTQAGTEASTAPVDVVLPAGGRISGAFAQAAGAEIKALITLNGQTILRSAIEAFRNSGRVGRIVVIGPEEALCEARASGAEGAVTEGATGPENIFRGLEWLRETGSAPASRAVISATDLPFLTPEAIAAYLDACPAHADIAVPLLMREAFEARFPGSQNIYVPLRDGACTVGCVFQINPAVLMQHRGHLERLFLARKSQFQMARLVGWRIAVGLATRRLTVPHIEARCGRILGCTGVGVRDCPPELGFDIDLPAEYEYVRACFERRLDGSARGLGPAAER